MAHRELPRHLQQVRNLLHPPSPIRRFNDCPRRETLLKYHLVLSLMGLLCLLVSCSSNREMAAVCTMLTSDHWMIELGSGLLQERYVYTFETNGAYKACVFSQYGTRPIKGRWKMDQDKQGHIHLLLENDEAYYFFLWRDSIIRHKKETDVLMVSGPHYGGEKVLRRTLNPRGVTNSAPALKPKAGGCRPAPGHASHRHIVTLGRKAGVKLGSP